MGPTVTRLYYSTSMTEEVELPLVMQLDAAAVPPVRVTCEPMSSRHWPTPPPMLDPPLSVIAPLGM